MLSLVTADQAVLEGHPIWQIKPIVALPFVDFPHVQLDVYRDMPVVDAALAHLPKACLPCL